jgi:uncharacterized protein (DUF427 family)
MAEDRRIHLQASPHRVRVVFNGAIVAESDHAVILREDGHAPVFYFPRQDVRTDLLRRTEHGTHCPYKGDASYWTLGAGGKSAENAVWCYENPVESMAGIKGHMAFYEDRVDAIEVTDGTATRTA